MAELHVLRTHSLGLPQARQLALRWVAQAESEFGLHCTYAQGRQEDEVGFSRPGVDGTLVVSHDRFELKAKLGFLLGAFKSASSARSSATSTPCWRLLPRPTSSTEPLAEA